MHNWAKILIYGSLILGVAIMGFLIENGLLFS